MEAPRMDSSSATVPAAVEVRNLTKVFALSLTKNYVVAVEDLSLTVGSGEVYGLIGPNGSGKSTTMKVVLGLMAPTSGTTRVFGVESNDVRSRQQIGFLPENPYFYKHLTGYETLLFYGRLCGLRGRELKDRAHELLALVDLERARDRRLAGYSKGMLQRIGLAQALVQRPRLVVLDEPTAGVDPIGSRQIRDLILRLKEEGISVFLCSHLLEQVQEVCDRVGIIANGRMWREGSLKDLIAIEDQTEIILRDASPELLARIADLVKADAGGAEWLGSGNPRTTLERLFLDSVRASQADADRRAAEAAAREEK
ncbi:MAG: ABC transporter ATP-binding protein [Verrucomicrobiales bacterium]|nr:ABC transporter ATP-binding protein [Verrucomicrobiales bacterium]